MTEPTRTVGLVGAGMIAPHHLDALAALPWVRVAGVTDLDRGRAEALAAARPGTAVYDLARRPVRRGRGRPCTC